ncbi:MAG: hypothetical protein ABI718_10535 [Acidobacteriota bacterium]
MPFRTVLRNLIDSVDGAMGAMFLDYEGEAVEVVSNGNRHDFKIIGAYQGIFLYQARKICRDTRQGTPLRFALQLEEITILTRTMADGYYLVLVLGRNASESQGWHQMNAAHAVLSREI